MSEFPLYSLEQLMTLISSAKEYGIEFIYAISPGLDITFSNQKEVSALKRKLDQAWQCYCTTLLWKMSRNRESASLRDCTCVSFTPCVILYSFCLILFPVLLPTRLLTLAASLLPYYLMILTTTCALLTKRCSAHLHMLRFPSPMKSSSTWENLKPSSSVPQVAYSSVQIHHLFYLIA